MTTTALDYLQDDAGRWHWRLALSSIDEAIVVAVGPPAGFPTRAAAEAGWQLAIDGVLQRHCDGT